MIGECNLTNDAASQALTSLAGSAAIVSLDMCTPISKFIHVLACNDLSDPKPVGALLKGSKTLQILSIRSLLSSPTG